MKYIIYCRKSTDTEDKQALSLESQENEMLSIAKENNLNVTTILKESQSAKDTGRPVFRKMVQMIQDGEVDGVLCWKLDRLARNMLEGGQIMDMLQRGVIKEIRSYENVHTPSDNVLLLAVHFGMANQYSRDLSVNVKRGNRAKLERGEWPNHAPFGYRNNKETKTLSIDKNESKIVLKIYELYISGTNSLRDIANILYNEGYRSSTKGKIYKAKVEKILKNHFYYGVMIRDGKYYMGKHKPIISKKIFNEAQETLLYKHRPRGKKLFFPLRGLLTCANCGCMLTASLKKGHQYYYCTNGKGTCQEHKKYLRSELLDTVVSDALENIKFDKELIEIMYEASKEKVQHLDSHVVTERDRLQGLVDALDERESTLFDTYADKLLSRTLYEKKMREIENERLVLKNELSNPNIQDPLITLEPTKNIFLTANKAKKEFLEGDDSKKNKIANLVLWNLSLENGNVAQTKYKSAYQLLANAPKTGDFETMLPD